MLSEALLYLFFAGAGAAGGAAGAVLKDAGPKLLAFLGLLYLGHGAVVYVVGRRILRLPAAVLGLASNAAIGGPATAAALANAKGWDGAVAPSQAASFEESYPSTAPRHAPLGPSRSGRWATPSRRSSGWGLRGRWHK